MFLENKTTEIALRAITTEDAKAGSNYANWMNDPNVTRYLESRYYPWSPEKLQAYAHEMNTNPNIVFLAVINTAEGKHIGNVKLGPINWMHRFAEIGIVLCEEAQGHNVGSIILVMMRDYAFATLGLHKIWAGILSPHVASVKAFEKAGFKQEGVLRSQYLINNEFVDDIIMAAWNPTYKEPI